MQQDELFPVAAACLQSHSGKLQKLWKQPVPNTPPLQCSVRGYLSVTGPFVDPFNRAGQVAFILEAQLCLAQSLFEVF